GGDRGRVNVDRGAFALCSHEIQRPPGKFGLASQAWPTHDQIETLRVERGFKLSAWCRVHAESSESIVKLKLNSELSCWCGGKFGQFIAADPDLRRRVDAEFGAAGSGIDDRQFNVVADQDFLAAFPGEPQAAAAITSGLK